MVPERRGNTVLEIRGGSLSISWGRREWTVHKDFFFFTDSIGLGLAGVDAVSVYIHIPSWPVPSPWVI